MTTDNHGLNEPEKGQLNWHTDVNGNFATLDILLQGMSSDGTDLEIDNLTSETKPWADVSAYGAVGDGVTDDTQAILDAVSSGASAVYLSPGTYSVTSNIDVGDVHLMGSGWAHTTISVDADLDRAITVSTSGGKVSDLHVNGNSRTVEGVRLNANQTSVRDVFVENISQYGSSTSTTSGIAVLSSQDAVVSDCYVSGIDAPNSGVARGIRVGGAGDVSGSQVLDCYVKNVIPTGDGDAITVQSTGEGCEVRDCVIREFAKSGVKVGNSVTGTVVSGCRFENSSVTSASAPVRIQGNGTVLSDFRMTVPDAGAGLFIQDGPSDITVTGGTIEITNGKSTSDGISLSPGTTNVTVSGVTIDMNSSGRHGVRLPQSEGVSFNCMTFSNVTNGSGIRFFEDGIVDVSVSNSVFDVSQAAVYVGDNPNCARIVVSGNVGTAGWGLLSDTNAIATAGANDVV